MQQSDCTFTTEHSYSLTVTTCLYSKGVVIQKAVSVISTLSYNRKVEQLNAYRNLLTLRQKELLNTITEEAAAPFVKRVTNAVTSRGVVKGV